MNNEYTIAEIIIEVICEINDAIEDSRFFKPISALFDVALIGVVAATGRVFV